jgi:hypothetical protein
MSSWNRWLNSLNGRRVRRPLRTNKKSQQLTLTALESRDVPSAFAQGDLVVLRVGTGTGALGTGATASFLDEKTTAGAAVQSIALPTTTGTNQPHLLTEPGSTVGDGMISNTVDGRYLLVTGYDAATTVSSVASTTAAANNRVIGRVDSTGAVNTTTGLTDANGNIREAASTDGQAIYTAGSYSTTSPSTGPIRLAQYGVNQTTTTLGTFGTLSTAGFTGVEISGDSTVSSLNNLYISGSVTNLDGIAQTGSGLPTTGGQTTTSLPGFPTTASGTFPAPRQFIFSPDGGTLYVADSRTAANGANFYGGIEVWKLHSGSWGLPGGTDGTNNNSPDYTLTPGAFNANNEGVVGMVADFSGAQPVFYATTVTASSSTSTLVKITDTGAANTLAAPILATAGTNQAFRGVAFAPKAPVTTLGSTVTVTSTAPGNTAPLNTPVTFTATVNGTGAAPTGWISFSFGGAYQSIAKLAPTGNPGESSAQFTASLPIGSDVVTGAYGGDLNYVSSSNTYTLTVQGTTTTTGVVSNNSTPNANNQSVTFTATVHPAVNTYGFPAGTVNFLDNGIMLGSASVTASGTDGSAQLTVSTAALQAAGKLTPGGHVITAQYVPGGPFTASSGTTNQTVTANTFGTGDIVVYRVGDGSTTLSTAGAGTTVWLDELTTAGAIVQSIVLPPFASGSNHGLVGAGNTVGDGIASNTADGRYLLITGYEAALGTAGVTGIAPATANRVVGRIDKNGNIDTTTALNNVANNIRNTASEDGIGLWNVGSSGGSGATGNLSFTTYGASGAGVAISSFFSGTSATTGLYSAAIQNNAGSGQLYVGGGATNIDGVASVTGGLATTPQSGTSEVLLNGFPGANTPPVASSPNPFPAPKQFFYSPDNSVIYMADSRTVTSTGTMYGGLEVWKLHPGNTWGISGGTNATTSTGTPVGNQPDYVITISGSNNEGLVGIVPDFTNYTNTSGSNQQGGVFYAVTSEANGTNKLVKITDGGSAGASTVSTLMTAPTNEQFDGVAFAPTPLGALTDTNTVTSSAAGNTAPIGTPVTFTSTIHGAGAVPTGWITFEQTTGTTTTVVGVASLTPTGNPGEASAQFTATLNTLGNTTVTAVYGGDSNYVTKTTPLAFNVTGTPTNTAVATNNPTATAANQSITFTATVTPQTGSAYPAGSVEFFADGIDLGPASVTQVGTSSVGTATVTVSTAALQATNKLTPGVHTIIANYSPGGAFLGSSGSVVQNVKANAFGAGDVLLFRAGDGTAALSVNGNVVYIDEVNPGTTSVVQSILMPTSSVAGGNQALLTDSQQSPEGQLSLSGDGQYVYLTGYDQALSTAQGANGQDLHLSTGAAIRRTIGRIKYDGTIDTSMALSDLSDGGDVRGVASPDGTQVYATGTTGTATGSLGGIRYVGAYNSATTTSLQIDDASNGTNGAASGAPLSLNALGIYGGQLYVSDSANNAAVKVATVGTGLPTTSGQTDTILPGLPTVATANPTPTDDTPLYTNAPGFPVGFIFAKLGNGPSVGPDTLYVADDGPGFLTGNITKWALVSGSWVKVGTVQSQQTSGQANTTSSPIPTFVGLNGTVSGSTATLYATWGNGGGTGNAVPAGGKLFSIIDTAGYNTAFSNSTPTTLLTAPALTIYRGVAPVPTQAAPAPTVSTVVVNNNQAQTSSVTTIQVTFSTQVNLGSGAFTLTRVGTYGGAAGDGAMLQSSDGTIAVATQVVSGQTVATLTFSGANTVGGSLNDGNWTLTVNRAAVTNATGGTPMAADYTQAGIKRLYGDYDGSGTVNALDYGHFRLAYGTSSGDPAYVAFFDYDASGAINAFDYGQFRLRYGLSI